MLMMMMMMVVVVVVVFVTDLDPGILDISHTAKIGLQATLTSNHTHPAHLVLGNGAILQPGILTSATIALTVVSLQPSMSLLIKQVVVKMK